MYTRTHGHMNTSYTHTFTRTQMYGHAVTHYCLFIGSSYIATLGTPIVGVFGVTMDIKSARVSVCAAGILW